jgi:hypothetical protein
MTEVTVKLISGDLSEEITMTRIPKLGEKIPRQGRIWVVVATEFLAAS